jgi:NAD+ kinase
VVIKSANPSQLAWVKLYINDLMVADFSADGIIFSTPTGSTAYTLSAGGPILSPDMEVIAITPICPHSFSAKPIVVPANARLMVEPTHKRHDTEVQQALVCAVDGLDCDHLEFGDRLTVTSSPLHLKMVSFGADDGNFYRLLKQKLHWAQNPRL